MQYKLKNSAACSLFVTLCFVATAGTANEKDSDGDGISDLEETTIYKTDMHLKDTDTDGLDDGLELDEYFTDPKVADTDGDGFIDGVEANNNSDPTDSDSIPTAKDLDHDGLSNEIEENKYHTDAQRVDTDFDGLRDDQEILKYFTNPKMVDTDGDSFWDGEEVNANTDPADATSFPEKSPNK